MAPTNKINATYPHRLLWFIRLVLISLLHVHGREKEFGGVWVDRPLDKLDMARHVEAKEVPGGDTLFQVHCKNTIAGGQINQNFFLARVCS